MEQQLHFSGMTLARPCRYTVIPEWSHSSHKKEVLCYDVSSPSPVSNNLMWEEVMKIPSREALFIYLDKTTDGV